MAIDTDRIRGRIHALKEQWGHHGPERERIAKLKRMAQGSWVTDIPGMPDEVDKSIKPRFAPNFLGFILDKRCTLYDNPPIRTAANEGEQQWLDDKIWSWVGGRFNNTLQEVEKMTMLTGTTLVQPAYRLSPTHGVDVQRYLMMRERGDLAAQIDPSNDGVELLCHARGEYEVLVNPYDRRHATAVLIYMGRVERSDRMVWEPDHMQDVWHYWDDEVMVRIEGDHFVPIANSGADYIEHGYGMLPFVVSRYQRVSKTFASPNLGGHDLYHNVMSLGRFIREYIWTTMLQRGQPVIRGTANPQNLVLGPDAFILLPDPNSDFAIEGGKANLMGFRDALRELLDTFSMTLGLPAGTWRVELTSNQSGVAVALQQAEGETDRKRRASVYIDLERALTQAATRVYNAERGTGYLGDSATQFPVPPPLRTYEQILKVSEEEWQKGLLSDVGYLQARHPERTRAQLEAQIEEAAKALVERVARQRLLAGTPLAEDEGDTPPVAPPPDA